MSHTKSGNKKNKPSHLRYISSGRRKINKIRRITKNNGQAFLASWMATIGK